MAKPHCKLEDTENDSPKAELIGWRAIAMEAFETVTPLIDGATQLGEAGTHCWRILFEADSFSGSIQSKALDPGRKGSNVREELYSLESLLRGAAAVSDAEPAQKILALHAAQLLDSLPDFVEA